MGVGSHAVSKSTPLVRNSFLLDSALPRLFEISPREWTSSTQTGPGTYLCNTEAWTRRIGDPDPTTQCWMSCSCCDAEEVLCPEALVSALVIKSLPDEVRLSNGEPRLDKSLDALRRPGQG